MTQIATIGKETTLGELDPPQSQEGTRFAPYSEGKHVLRFVDYVDLGMQQFKPTDKPSRRVCFLLWGAEKDVDGNPKFVQFYCSTSLFGGGEGASPSNLMRMLRGCTGNPALTEEQVRGIKIGKLMGRRAGVLIGHKTSAAGRVRAEVHTWSHAGPDDGPLPQPPGLEAYSRPEWFDAKRVDYVPPEQQEKDMRPLTAEELKAAVCGELPEPESDNLVVETEGAPAAEFDAAIERNAEAQAAAAAKRPAGGPSETAEALAQASDDEVPF